MGNGPICTEILFSSTNNFGRNFELNFFMCKRCFDSDTQFSGTNASDGILGTMNDTHNKPSENETAYRIATDYVQVIDYWFQCKSRFIHVSQINITRPGICQSGPQTTGGTA